MNTFTGLHAAAWLAVYTSAIAVALLSGLLARGEADRPKKRLAAREAYAVAIISLAYVSDALGLNAALPSWATALFTAIVNGALLQALALIAIALYPFAASLAESCKPPRKGTQKRGNAGHAAAGLLGAGFGLATLIGGRPSSGAFVRALAIGPLAIVATGLTAAVGASAWRIITSRGSIGIGTRGTSGSGEPTLAVRMLTAAGTAAYAAFIAFELLPQFKASTARATPPTYFALAAFFAFLNGGLIALLISCVGRAGAPGGRATSPDASDMNVESLASAFSESRMIEAGLSAREREVARLLIAGASYKDVSMRLFVSISTVQTHVTRVYAKLGVSSKVELANALRNGPGIV